MKEILAQAVARGASDIFIIAGAPLTYKINAALRREDAPPLMPQDTEAHIRELYGLAGRRETDFFGDSGVQRDDDFSFSINGMGRFRVNVFRQRGSCACVIRVIRFGLPSPEELLIPERVLEFAERKKGLVLVTGMASSGKSTTLACIVDRINRTQEKHIITMEEPIEYLHRHNKSIVTQREIPVDVPSYVEALRSALRESPDVILLGELRDAETMEVSMTAAETGQLLFSTLHTVGAVNAVDRIVDAFPPDQQQQIRMQLSMVLQGVISQQLLPAIGGGLVPAFEILTANAAVRNLIREGNTHQLPSAMAAAPDMVTMDNALIELVKTGKIEPETAIAYSQNPDFLRRKL